MNILFFINPFETHGVPFNTARGMVAKLPPMVAALKAAGLQVQVLTSAAAAGAMAAQSSGVFSGVDRLHRLTDAQLFVITGGFPSLGREMLTSAAPACVAATREVLAGIDGLAMPDVVIVPFTETAFLKAVFPDAQVVFFETGLVCHLPFSQFHVFDPFGTFREGAYFSRIDVAKMGGEVDAYLPLLDRIGRGIRDFSRAYIDEAGGRRALRRGFSRVLMMPLQVTDSPSFAGVVRFPSQFALLEHVLACMPRDIGLLITEHPVFPQITAAQHDYLTETYSNYIYYPRLQRMWSLSAVVLPAVDAVIGVSSTVLLQAHAIGLRTFSIGHGPFAALNGSADLDSFFSELALDKPYETPRRVLLDIVARYSVPRALYQSTWLGLYLQSMLDNFVGSTPRLPLIAEPDVLLKYYEPEPLPRTLVKPRAFFNDDWISAPLAMRTLDMNPLLSMDVRLTVNAKYTVAVLLDHFGVGGTQRVVQRLIKKMPDVHWLIVVENRIDNEFPQLDNCDILVCEPQASADKSAIAIASTLKAAHAKLPISLLLNPCTGALLLCMPWCALKN
jgi:hypothetical protein